LALYGGERSASHPGRHALPRNSSPDTHWILAPKTVFHGVVKPERPSLPGTEPRPSWASLNRLPSAGEEVRLLWRL
jgi:hypothetical protein